MANTFPHGTVHKAGEDLQAALRPDQKVFVLWENLTPLGRNEFICRGCLSEASQKGAH
jgi:hypothetical protein